MSWRPSPNKDAGAPRPVAASLDRVTRGLGGPSGETLTALYRSWENLVGPHIAAHARPLSLVKGVLSIGVDDPAWAVQIRFLEGELLAKLGTATGASEITAVRVKVRPS